MTSQVSKQNILKMVKAADTATGALEQILANLNGDLCYERKSGETCFLEERRILGALALLYEFNAAARGKADDYLNLAQLEMEIAGYAEIKQEKLRNYWSSANHLRKAAKKDRHGNYLSDIVSGMINIWDELEDIDSSENRQRILEDAYKQAKRLADYPIKEYHDYHTLGKVYYEVAVSGSHPEQKSELLKKAIEFFEEAVVLNSSAMYLYSLGQAQGEYASCCPDPAVSMQVRAQALSALNQSYQLDNDPVTLELIEEIEGDTDLI